MNIGKNSKDKRDDCGTFKIEGKEKGEGCKNICTSRVIRCEFRFIYLDIIMFIMKMRKYKVRPSLGEA